MWNQTLKVLKQKKIIDESKDNGYTEEDVQKIEAHFKIKLPLYYRKFLKEIGKLFDIKEGINNGLVLRYKSLYTFLSEFNNDILDVNLTNFKLPGNAFIFAIEDCEHAYYFLCSEEQDPEVFQFSSTSDKPFSYSKCFTEFLYDQVEIIASDWI